MWSEEEKAGFSKGKAESGVQYGSLKTSGQNCSFSLVQQQNLHHVFFVAESCDNRDDIISQFEDVKAALNGVVGTNGLTELVALSVFLPDIGQKQLLRQKFREYFGEKLPVITHITQTSCFGRNLIVEGYGVRAFDESCEIVRHNEHAVQLVADGMSILFCGDIRSDDQPLMSYERSLSSFTKLQNLLTEKGYDLSDLYRTWLYQGHIVDAEGGTQRYKELNRARTDVFGDRRFLEKYLPQSFNGTAFPASTGIGADDYDLVVAAQAIRSDRTDLIFVPLENPLQVSAFNYAQKYSPKSPKFSRAMAFVAGTDAMVYISGTASITASESRFPGDAERQTHQTLDNIAALVTGENLANHGVAGFRATLEHCALARVYVKNQSDFPTIRRVCEERLAKTPILYVVADVCRPELLVEIEGIIAPIYSSL